VATETYLRVLEPTLASVHIGSWSWSSRSRHATKQDRPGRKAS